jgi:hypothetical protein
MRQKLKRDNFISLAIIQKFVKGVRAIAVKNKHSPLSFSLFPHLVIEVFNVFHA